MKADLVMLPDLFCCLNGTCPNPSQTFHES